MDIEDDAFLIIEKIPRSKNCCFCIPLRRGTIFIAILGILLGFSCAAMLLLKDRSNLSISTSVLVVLMSIFIVVTLVFVISSVLLLVAALDDNPDLMVYYIWLAIFYLFIQSILAICIPVVLVIEGKYSVAAALIWIVVVMIVGLGWTHFISVVNTYRKSLL